MDGLMELVLVNQPISRFWEPTRPSTVLVQTTVDLTRCNGSGKWKLVSTYRLEKAKENGRGTGE